MATLSTLLAVHEARLLVVTNREVRAVLAAVRDSEREVLTALATEPNLLRRDRLGTLVSRLATYRVSLEARLRGVLDPADARVIDMAGAHLAALVRVGGTVALTDTQRLAALSRLTTTKGLLLHQHSVAKYSRSAIDRIQAAVVSGVVAGEPEAAIVRRVSGATGPLALNRREAELVTRMELSRAYSGGSAELAAVLYEDDNGWRKRIVEIIDSRNHPFSRAADGTLAKPGERFKVSVSDVASAAASMKRRAYRVLWPESGGFYRGMSMPAHYGERGRVVPWHTTWGA